MMAEKASEWVKNEFTRFKDFLASMVKLKTEEYAYAAFQDGGALKENVLATMGPEIWEDFQTNFIETSQ